MLQILEPSADLYDTMGKAAKRPESEADPRAQWDGPAVGVGVRLLAIRIASFVLGAQRGSPAQMCMAEAG